MSIYLIEQTATAVVLWIGEADDETDAKERCAREAGYASWAESLSVADDAGIVVRDISGQAEEGGSK